jgi:hypothetical protein
MEGLRADFVWPRYEGLSVGNVPATLVRLLGGEARGLLPPLRSDLLEGLTDGVERVVVILLDGLGWMQLQGMMARDDELVFHELAEMGRLSPLTTIFPSTTNNVLSTLRTGAPPARHGLLAYELYLREWAVAAECIGFSPIVARGSGALVRWGLDPETFLPVPSLAQILSAQGVPTEHVIAYHMHDGPLTRMFFRGAHHIHGHNYGSDLWSTLREALEKHRGERFLLGGYWSAVDSLAHRHGPQHPTGFDQVRSISYQMKTIFLDPLAAADRDGTLLLILADHGQLTPHPESAVLMDDHPLLADALILPPLGEHRLPFFYVRAGRLNEVRDYLEGHFGDVMTVLSREEVLESGLLGPGAPYREVPHRLGDLIGLMHEDAIVVRTEELLEKLVGRHGGLSPREMLVPLLAARLDA